MSINVSRIVEKCVLRIGSKRALAKYLGVDERSVYRWVNNACVPRGKMLITLCNMAEGNYEK